MNRPFGYDHNMPIGYTEDPFLVRDINGRFDPDYLQRLNYAQQLQRLQPNYQAITPFPINQVSYPMTGFEFTNHWFPPQQQLPIMESNIFHRNAFSMNAMNLSMNPVLNLNLSKEDLPSIATTPDYSPESSVQNSPRFGPGPPIITSDRVKGPRGCNLFVFHLPNEITNWDLYLLFRRFGTILSVHIMISKTTGLSRGFGFVSFAAQDEAMAAIEGMNGYRLGKKKFKVQLKRSQDDDHDSFFEGFDNEMNQIAFNMNKAFESVTAHQGGLTANSQPNSTESSRISSPQCLPEYNQKTHDSTNQLFESQTVLFPTTSPKVLGKSFSEGQLKGVCFRRIKDQPPISTESTLNINVELNQIDKPNLRIGEISTPIIGRSTNSCNNINSIISRDKTN